jgi:hypothetical protein
LAKHELERSEAEGRKSVEVVLERRLEKVQNNRRCMVAFCPGSVRELLGMLEPTKLNCEGKEIFSQSFLGLNKAFQCLRSRLD